LLRRWKRRRNSAVSAMVSVLRSIRP